MNCCVKCGKPLSKHDWRYHGSCQGCYRYYREGGTDNPLPEAGTVTYDHRGFVVCHICGRAYKRLGSHVKESHKMTIAEYKATFGLCNKTKTTEQSYSEHMKTLALHYNMDDQLRICGVNTRIKKGESNKRKGKQVRLQEILEKKNRNKMR